jgi:hypothetical protein
MAAAAAAIDAMAAAVTSILSSRMVLTTALQFAAFYGPSLARQSSASSAVCFRPSRSACAQAAGQTMAVVKWQQMREVEIINNVTIDI